MLECWRSHRHKLAMIIADIDLPKRSGLESLREIRAAGNRTPVILVSGAADCGHEDVLDGHTSVLRKPFSMAELIERAAASNGGSNT